MEASPPLSFKQRLWLAGPLALAGLVWVLAQAGHAPLRPVAAAFAGATARTVESGVRVQAEYRPNLAAAKGVASVEQLLHLSNAGGARQVQVVLTQRIRAQSLLSARGPVALPGPGAPLSLDECLDGQAYAVRFDAGSATGGRRHAARYDWSDLAAFGPSARAWADQDGGLIEITLRVPVAADSDTVIDPKLELSTSLDYNLEVAGANGAFGTVLESGDLNGDGKADLVVSAPTYNGAFSFEGAVYVFYGGNLTFTAGVGQLVSVDNLGPWNVRFTGGANNVQLGQALVIGDFNGDGTKDLAIGAVGMSPSAVAIYYGGSTNFPAGTGHQHDLSSSDYNLLLQDSAASFSFGSALAAGDLDGDGKDDLAISSPTVASLTRTFNGQVYVLRGSVAPFPGLGSTGNTALVGTAYAWTTTFDGPTSMQRLGQSLAIGDVNGDGTGDLVIGQPMASNAGRSGNGAAFVIYGSAARFPALGVDYDLLQPAAFNLRLDGPANGATFAQHLDVGSLRSAAIDLAVAAPGLSTQGRSGNGAAYVIYGGPAQFPAGNGTIHDMAATFNWNVRLDGLLPSDAVGNSALRIGRAGVDALPDLMLGSINASGNGYPQSGSVWVASGHGALFGAGTGQVADLDENNGSVLRLNGPANFSALGSSLASGDVDDDGNADLLLGATGVNSNNGAIYAVYGGAGSIFARTPTPTFTATASPTPLPTLTPSYLWSEATLSVGSEPQFSSGSNDSTPSFAFGSGSGFAVINPFGGSALGTGTGYLSSGSDKDIFEFRIPSSDYSIGSHHDVLKVTLRSPSGSNYSLNFGQWNSGCPCWNSSGGGGGNNSGVSISYYDLSQGVGNQDFYVQVQSYSGTDANKAYELSVEVVDSGTLNGQVVAQGSAVSGNGNFNVYANESASGTYLGSANADGAGNFALRVPAGVLVGSLTASRGWYNGAPADWAYGPGDLALGSPINVGAGGTYSGLIINVWPEAVLTGTYANTTTTPNAWNFRLSGEYNRSNNGGYNNVTYSGGVYTLHNQRPGVYHLLVDPQDGLNAPVVADNVVLVDGLSTTQNLSFNTGGGISGTISPSGSNLSVQVYEHNFINSNSMANSYGVSSTFNVGRLAPGLYDVKVETNAGPSPYFGAFGVSISQGSNTPVNITALAQSSTISGTVVDALGLGAGTYAVLAYLHGSIPGDGANPMAYSPVYSGLTWSVQVDASWPNWDLALINLSETGGKNGWPTFYDGLASVPPGSSGQVLTSQGGHRISGQVLFNGAPFSFYNGGFTAGIFKNAGLRDGADVRQGSYTSHPLPIGSYQVKIDSAYLLPASKSVTLALSDLGGQDLTLSADPSQDLFKPGASQLSPPQGSTITASLPNISCLLSDGALGTGVKTSSISAKVDGTSQGSTSYNSSTGALSFVAPQSLSVGAHTVLINFQDQGSSPNLGTVSWTFWVSAASPTVTNTFSASPTNAPTATATRTPTPSVTQTFTASPLPSFTSTPSPFAGTPTATRTPNYGWTEAGLGIPECVSCGGINDGTPISGFGSVGGAVINPGGASSPLVQGAGYLSSNSDRDTYQFRIRASDINNGASLNILKIVLQSPPNGYYSADLRQWNGTCPCWNNNGGGGTGTNGQRTDYVDLGAGTQQDFYYSVYLYGGSSNAVTDSAYTVDLQMIPSGQLQGQVLAQGSSTATGYQVQAYDSEGNGVGSTTSDASGFFSLRVPAGVGVVRLEASAPYQVGGPANSAYGPTETLYSSPLTVGAGGLLGGLTLKAYPEAVLHGTYTGTANNPTNWSFSLADVYASARGGGTYYKVSTGTAGAFDVHGIKPGVYHLRVDPQDGTNAPAVVESVALTDGLVSTVNLNFSTGGALSGSLSPALASGSVELYESGFGDLRWVASGTVSASAFSIPRLATGFYDLQVSSNGPGAYFAQTVYVGGGGNFVPVSGLAATGTLGGLVTDSLGIGSGNLAVLAFIHGSDPSSGKAPIVQGTVAGDYSFSLAVDANFSQWDVLLMDKNSPNGWPLIYDSYGPVAPGVTGVPLQTRTGAAIHGEVLLAGRPFSLLKGLLNLGNNGGFSVLVHDAAGALRGGIDVGLSGYDTHPLPAGNYSLDLSHPFMLPAQRNVSLGGSDAWGQDIAMAVDDAKDVYPPFGRDLAPANGEVITAAQPLIQLRLSDGYLGTGIKAASIQARIDGILQAHSFDPVSGALSFQPTVALGPGTHTAQVDLTDNTIAFNSGNTFWSFYITVATPTITPTFSDSPTASPTYTVTPTFTVSPTPSASATASPSASPTVTLSSTASPSATATPTATLTATPTPSGTPTDSPSSTGTWTVTESPTPSVTPSATPSLTPSATPSATGSATASQTATATPTATPSATASASQTSTPTPAPACVWADGEDADVVLGQPDFVTATANLGGISASTLDFPAAALVVGTKLLVADYGNNRVLIWNSVPASVKAPADVVLGQADFTSFAPGTGANMLNGPMALASDGTKLFVSDYGNNRVLVYLSIPTVSGTAADLVLGQPAFGSGTLNAGGLSATSLSGPFGLVVAGNKLIIADSGNNRVLIHNTLALSNNRPADVVVGQTGFASAAFAVNAVSLHTPRGVSSNGIDLQIGDSANNRVLLYNSIPSANSAAADHVLGQMNFSSTSAGTSTSALSLPFMLLRLGNGLLVADRANNRVLRFDPLPTTDNAPANGVIGQANYTTGQADKGLGASGPGGFNAPAQMAVYGTQLIVPDFNSHRVLIFDCSFISTPTVTPSPTSSASPTASPTATPTATPTASATPSDSPTATPTVSATASASPTASGTPSGTDSPTPSATETASESPTVTVTPTFGCGTAGYLGSGTGGGPMSSTFRGTQITIPFDAIVTQLRYNFFFDGGGTVVIGLYTDVGNYPGALLTTSTLFASTGAGPRSIDVPDVWVPAGTYWLVGNGSGSLSIGSDLCCGTILSLAGAFGALPANLPGSGFVNGGQYYSFGADYCYSLQPTATLTATVTPTETVSLTDSPTPSATPTASGTWTATASLTSSSTPSATPTATTTPLPPNIIGVVPSSGLIFGGEAITITGSNFSLSAIVSFGGNNASVITPGTSTIIVIAPAGLSGTVAVVVTNPGGVVSNNGSYTYLVPTPTVTQTATATPSSSPTLTVSPTPSDTVTSTLTATQSATLTATPTATPSRTPSATLTATPSPSPTLTRSSTRTATPSPTPPNTATETPTASPTVTLTITRTPVPVLTATPSSTITPTFTISDTPLPTGTPDVPTVLDRNVWRPGTGQPLHIGIKAPVDGKVVVNVFNLAGEKVRRPFDADVVAGVTTDALWDGKNEDGEACGAGVYVISVQGAGISSLKKVVLMR